VGAVTESGRPGKGAKEKKTRNPKFETNPNDQKAQNPKLVLDFGFEGFGLFRISSFGFWAGGINHRWAIV
jgi:hypothetical protein